MNVSIFADASWCPDLRVGGWGAWAKSDRGRTQGGGALRGTVESNNVAETLALANALWLALSQGVAYRGDRVIATTDSQHALRLLDGVGHPATGREAQAVQWMRRICDSHDILLKGHHVKAHKAHLGKRHWVNGLCDNLARDGLQEARKAASAAPRFRVI